MTDLYQANLRFVGELEVGFDEDKGAEWVAKTIIEARNILNIGMRDGPQTGRQYPKGANVHIASKKGEWPAVDTGNLRINTRMVFDGLQGEIGSNVEYAGFLQNGTRKMGARKLYNEALEMAAQDMADELGEVIFVRVVSDNNDNPRNR